MSIVQDYIQINYNMYITIILVWTFKDLLLLTPGAEIGIRDIHP